MAKLNEEFFDQIASKIVKEGNPDDLAKFMLAGDEHIAAVQRYFYDLEADKKKELTLNGDEWFLGLDRFRNPFKKQRYTGLALFKLIAFSIIPHVEKLHIIDTHLDGYSFLGEIKNLNELKLQFADDEHIKVLSALSNLQAVNYLKLNIKGLNLQLLRSLRFSFASLIAKRFIFEANPKGFYHQYLSFLPFSFYRFIAKRFISKTNLRCAKIFQTEYVELHGDKEAMNDFVFNRQNLQNYADVFPNTISFFFKFYIKVVDDVSDLLKVAKPNYTDEVEVPNRYIKMEYNFFDYSGYPESKVLKMLQNNGGWHKRGCPYHNAEWGRYAYVTCHFPLAGPEIANILAEQPLRRIPEGSNGKSEEYYRLTIRNDWGHKAEFEVRKDILVKDLCKAYGEITGLNGERLRFNVDTVDSVYGRWISDGTVAENFQDGDTSRISFDLDYYSLLH